MNRASARSNSFTSTPRRSVATCSTAWVIASASRRLTPAMRSRSAACWTGSRCPAAPKSMSARCPSARSITLPGWGSAWNTPSCSICSRNARRSESANLTRSAATHAAPVDLAHAGAVEPLHDEDARRAELLVHERHADVRVAGHRRRDGGRVARLDAVVELLAQAGPRTRRRDPARGTRAPTSSASRPSARAPRAPRGRRAPTRRCRGAAPSRRRARRSGSCARYTWPIDAAATGCQSNPRNTSSTGASSSSSSTSAMASRGAGRTWSCNMPSSAAACGEIRSVRVLSTCPSFTNMPPHSSSASRSRRTGGRPPGASTSSLRPEARATDRGRCAPRCG